MAAPSPDHGQASMAVETSRSRPEKSDKRKRRPKRDDASESLPAGALKKNIRDLERLLQRMDNLPADVRLEKERALQSYKAELEDAQIAQRRRAMISRYHMVRFFERQKASRILKRSKKQLTSTDPADPSYGELKQATHRAEVDLNYTLYFPLMKKYQSLYPKGEAKEANDAAAATERPEMWQNIERAMAEGTLEQLRDWRPPPKRRATHTKKPSKPKKLQTPFDAASADVLSESRKDWPPERIVEDHDEPEPAEDDQSDGGFFEE